MILNTKDAFCLRMQGDAMLDAGIYNDDLLRVKPAGHIEDGQIVLALVQQDLLVRRYFKNNVQTILMAENVNYPAVIIDENDQIEICGVVEKL